MLKYESLKEIERRFNLPKEDNIAARQITIKRRISAAQALKRYLEKRVQRCQRFIDRELNRK